MQNLYMMATLVREQQMRKMAIEITKGLISAEQAMLAYNVSTREAVTARVEALKKENQRKAAREREDNYPFQISAA